MTHSLQLHNCVRRKRVEHGFTQSELGNVVQVTRQTIAFIEKGDFAPSIALALRLAEALTIPINELFWLEEKQ